MRNRVGLGTFPLANPFSKVGKKEAEKIIRLFIEKGGYYIDTAPMYGYGEVEKLLGGVLQNIPRESYYIATKCGFVGIEEKKLITNSKYKDILRECNKSLNRLKVDYIDLYFVHVPDPETPFEETVEALAKLQKEGKIKEIGISNVSLEELKEYNKTGKIKFVQNRFSLINRSIDQSFKQYLLANSISLVPYRVIERGQLTDKILKEITLRADDLRHTKPDWEEDKLSVIANWVKEKLYPIAKKQGISLKELAIAWALQQPFVGFIIAGATNTQQLLTNLKANKINLASEVLREIDLTYEGLKRQIKQKYGQEIPKFRGLNEKFY